jgi:hypothetical protein
VFEGLSTAWQAIVVTTITATSVALGAFWKSRQHPPDAAVAITSAANSLIEQYRARNDELVARIIKLELKLEECLAKHREQEMEIDDLQRRLTKLEGG